MNNNDHFWLDLAAIKYITDDNDKSNNTPNISPIKLIIFGVICIAISIWILRTI